MHIMIRLSFPFTRSRKLIQESEQHLKDVEKILQNDKRYHVLECVPDERRKLIMFYIEDLDRRGPPPPPTASEPTRRPTKWPRDINVSADALLFPSLPLAWAWPPNFPLHDLTFRSHSWPCSVIIEGVIFVLEMYHRDERFKVSVLRHLYPWCSRSSREQRLPEGDRDPALQRL